VKNLILANKIKLLAALAVVVVISATIYFKSGGDESTQTAIVSKSDIIQEVDVTGRVRAAQDVNLAFEDSGRIRSINAVIGQRVYVGQTLASLENGAAYANVLSAEADLKSEEANLKEVLAGARVEELEVLEAKVISAVVSLEDAKQNLLDKIKDAYTKGDDAIRNKADQFFSNPRSSNPIFNITTSQADIVREVETKRPQMEVILNTWISFIETLNTSSDLENASIKTRENLNTLVDFADRLAFIINRLEPSASLSSTVIDGYKTDVSTMRTNLNTALANLSTATEKLRTAETSLLVAEKNLALEKAGNSDEEIEVAQAKLEKAKANLARYQADYLRTIIRAPFNGTVTSREGDVGEIISAKETVLSLISDAKFEIDAEVPEADIVYLSVGDGAVVILDAYGKDTPFGAVVVSISQSGKIIEGVPTYKTIFQFKEEDEKIKSGMTADLSIITDKRLGVISIPQRAVVEEGGRKYVNKVNSDGSYEETPVLTGLEGSDGNVEIINGLKEGDKIVIFFRD